MEFYAPKPQAVRVFGRPLTNVLTLPPNVTPRLLDWFCNVYAKEKRITMQGTSCDVNSSLIAERIRLGGKYEDLDVFQRGNIKMMVDGQETTRGQLNFFLWASKEGVIDYCQKHYQEINQHMSSRTKRRSMRK